MKIMSIIRRITRKIVVAPSICKERLVELHPELLSFFSPEEQLTIVMTLWFRNKLSNEQAIALCPDAEEMINDLYEEYLAEREPDCEQRWDEFI